MADRQQPHQLQIHSQQRPGFEGMFKNPRGTGAGAGGPSATQIIALITLLPIGGTLLCLAGLTLAGSVIGLVLTTPLFIICSPILVPAAILISLAVTGFLTSGAFGLTGLSSLSWVLNCFRQKTGQEPLDYAKSRMQDAAVQFGHKTKDIGQRIESKAQEGGGGGGGRSEGGGAREAAAAGKEGTK